MKRLVWYSLRLQEILTSLGIIFGVWVMGMILHDIIIISVDEPEAFPLGTLMAIMVLVFFGIFASWGSMIQSFNTSISMGSTRKEYLIQYSIQYYIYMLINVVFIRLLNLYEEARVGWYLKDCYLEFSMSIIFKPIIFILVPFVMLGIGLLMGSVGIKFGSNSRYVMIILWIAICIGFSKIGDGAILEELFSLPLHMYGVIAAVIATLFTLIGVLIIRKQQVNV